MAQEPLDLYVRRNKMITEDKIIELILNMKVENGFYKSRRQKAEEVAKSILDKIKEGEK